MITIEDFRPEDDLRTEADIVDYLNLALEEAATFDDPREGSAFFAQTVGTAAKARKKISSIAADTNRTREGMYKSLSKKGDPAFSTILSAIHALGGELSVTLPTAATK